MKFTLLSTVFSTGLIWTIQLVHYPGFLKIGAPEYVRYQRFHMQKNPQAGRPR